MFRAFFVLLLAGATTWADVPLKPAHHVPNGVPDDAEGYCQWASWQTAGNVLHIKALQDLKARRAKVELGHSYHFVYTGGYHWDHGLPIWNGYWQTDRTSPGPARVGVVIAYLKALGVQAESRHESPSIDFLQQVSDRGVGAVCQMIDLPGLRVGSHVVYVIGCTRDKQVCYNRYTRVKCQPERLVTFYDCNYPGETFTVEYSWFARYWDGTASYLARPKPPPKVRRKR